jgi:hypothetical protein
MWARDLEFTLALWLAASPFVFRHPPEQPELWRTDFISAGLIALLSLASYAPRLRRAHLLELAVAAWLVGYGWSSALEGHAPANQNHITVGLLLGMLAIVPSHASAPPPRWRELRAGADDAEDKRIQPRS